MTESPTRVKSSTASVQNLHHTRLAALRTTLSGGQSNWKSASGSASPAYKLCIWHLPELCTSATSFMATNQQSLLSFSWDLPPLASRQICAPQPGYRPLFLRYSPSTQPRAPHLSVCVVQQPRAPDERRAFRAADVTIRVRVNLCMRAQSPHVKALKETTPLESEVLDVRCGRGARRAHPQRSGT